MNKESLHYRPEMQIPWRKHLLRLFYGAPLVPAPMFWERFLLLMATFANLSSWLGIVYLIRIWKPFSPYVLDKIVMAEVFLFLPLAFIVNRLLDASEMARNRPEALEEAVGRSTIITNPALLAYSLWLEAADRIKYRRR